MRKTIAVFLLLLFSASAFAASIDLLSATNVDLAVGPKSKLTLSCTEEVLVVRWTLKDAGNRVIDSGTMSPCATIPLPNLWIEHDFGNADIGKTFKIEIQIPSCSGEVCFKTSSFFVGKFSAQSVPELPLPVVAFVALIALFVLAQSNKNKRLL